MKQYQVIMTALLSAVIWTLSFCVCVAMAETINDDAPDLSDIGPANISVLSYHMGLKLDTVRDRLEETVEMELKNNGNEETKTLFLRYYPNGYVPYLSELYPEENKGKAAAVTSVAAAGTDRELPVEYFLDHTLLKVSLETCPIRAGRTMRLKVSAWTDLPVGNDRFGTARWEEGKLYHLTFCFPFLEYNHNDEWVLDPPGYSFLENRCPMTANYYITLEAPENYMIAAPGKMSRTGAKTIIEAQDLRDPGLFVSDCMGVDEFKIGGTAVRNYYLKMKGEEDYRIFSKQFLTDAFEHLTALIGEYGRSEFVLVEGTVNMEYSGIAEVSGHGFYEDDPSGYEMVYENTVHEVGHQWFFDGVGSCESREGWIDEGFTSFLEAEILCEETKSRQMMSNKNGEWITAEEYEEEKNNEWDLLRKDLEGSDHYSLTDPEANSLKTFLGREMYINPGAGLAEYYYAPLFLQEVKEIMGEEKFYLFAEDVYQTYYMRIADTEGILDLLRKHDHSEEMNRLVRYFFDPGINII